MSTIQKLEDNESWKLAGGIAEYVYGLLGELPEEEKWDMQSKLRQRAFSLTSNISEACGSVDPRDKNISCAQAMRDVFGLKNALIMASKTYALDLDPATMVKLNKLADIIDDAISESAKAAPEYLNQFSKQEEKS